MFDAAPISLTILIITVAIHFLVGQEKTQKLLLHPFSVLKNKEYFRLISSGFVHADLAHLGFNMFALFIFGPQVEQVFTGIFGTLGSVFYILLYLGAIVIGDIPTLLKHKDDYHYRSLGASGGVSGIVFAYVLMAPINDICLYGILCFPGFIWALIYAGYSFYQSKNATEDYINHSAHLYGALFGFFFPILLEYKFILSFINEISDWITKF